MPQSRFFLALVNPETIPEDLITQEVIYFCSPKDTSEILNPELVSYWQTYANSCIDKGQALLFRQQIVGLAGTPETCKYEALLRLVEIYGAESKVVPAGAFFPHVSHLPELMEKIDHWVVRRAIAAAEPDYYYSVNLSVHAITPDLPHFVERCLRMGRTKPEQITFEITEQMELHIPSALSVLKDLKAIGCSLALDDVGEKFSGLGYLQELPLDEMKIDSKLIRNIAINEKSQAIATGILTIASLLGISVVAEGIEDGGAALVLKLIYEKVVAGTGKEFKLSAQGYFFHKPERWA